MTQINSLIQFTAGQKAVAADVNSNFEALREANNSLDTLVSDLNGAIQTPPAVSITSISGVLTLLAGSSGSNVFYAGGPEEITSITGWSSGIAVIKWTTNRPLIYSSSLLLQNSQNRYVKSGDISIFEFNNGVTREINYFPITSPASPTVLMPAYTPYSVVSGQQSGGYAQFLSSAGSSSVLLSASTVPLSICYPNGTLESVLSNMTVTGLSKGGGYVVSLVGSGTTATVTTSTSHNLVTGDTVTIAGATTSSYFNGTFTVTVSDSTHFTYAMSGSYSGTSSGSITYSITYTLVKELDTYTVTSLTRSGTVVTAVTSIPTQLQTGDSVTIAGCAQTDYNGTFAVTVTSATSFTYTVSSSQDTTALGTITASIGLRSIYALSYNKVTESISFPSSGNSGDYWLCYGLKPYGAYKNISGTWTPVQFVKLGEATITSGSMGTPISYAFNGQYVSGWSIGANSSSITYLHNLGISANLLDCKLFAQINGNYTPGGSMNHLVGDIIPMPSTMYSSASATRWYSLNNPAKNKIIFSMGATFDIPATSGDSSYETGENFNMANWQLVVRRAF